MSHNVRDWIEVRREYERQLAELEARLDARAAANARQVQQLAEWSERLRAQRTQGNVTQ